MNAAIKERVIELSREGVSYYEIERTLGVQHATASKWARAAGIKRGRGGGCVASRASQMNAEKLGRLSDMYAGRYEFLELRPGGHAHVRCLSCGCEFDRTIDLRYSITCPECERRRVELNESKREHERDERQKAREIVRVFRKFLSCKQINQWLDEPHTCKECGSTFTMRELREANPSNYTSNPTFCCKRCSRRYNKRQQSHVRRAIERGEHADQISLSALVKRDDETCYLCGGKVDTNDYISDGSGLFVAGDMYPSIDHVVPLSKGGTHTWDNVRLAHHLCNAIKSNDSIGVARSRIEAKGVG